MRLDKTSWTSDPNALDRSTVPHNSPNPAEAERRRGNGAGIILIARPVDAVNKRIVLDPFDSVSSQTFLMILVYNLPYHTSIGNRIVILYVSLSSIRPHIDSYVFI